MWYTQGALEEQLARKRSLPRYEVPPGPFPFFDSFVLSLPNATDRRANAAAEMERHGVTRWQFFDAINGSTGLPQDEASHLPLARARARMREFAAFRGC